MIELGNLDVRHFVIEVSPSSEWLDSEMWLHRFDIISLSINHMSGCNNMRYKYNRICFGISMQGL